MKRFFVEEISGDIAAASKEESAHIIKVMRLKIGDEAIVFDGMNNSYKAVLTDDSKNAKFKIIEIIDDKNESPLNIKVYQAVIKNDKIDYVVQKCVELGVSIIQPMISKYCVKRPKNPTVYIERLNRIALSAAKQSGRTISPEVLPIIDIDEIPPLKINEKRLFAYENEKETSLKSIINNWQVNEDRISEVSIIVGPEGGFDFTESQALIQNGADSVSLGKRILRSETAAPFIAGVLMYEYEL